MGRHRRSAAGRPAGGRATGATHTQDATTERYGPENLYGFAAVLEAETPYGQRSHRKQKKTMTPVKTGLLGVSAAVAIGTVAVATGVLPGGDKYAIGSGGSADTVTPAGTPSSIQTQQGGTDGTADRGEKSTSRGSERETSPSVSPSKTATPPKKTPSKKPSSEATKPEKIKKPAAQPTKKPEQEAPVTVSAEAKAEAEVLRLVNEERDKAGCSPVAANSALTKLAGAFSDDMAERGFFDHTDPEGDTPWDRAAALGITNLGGENIARGQATAATVVVAWINSPGHRANILNCDFKTLGVGVHLGSGGPWWTQDFGY